MKPTVKVAMSNLIAEARKRIPFNVSLSSDCEGRCDVCPYKRLEWLDIELSDWQKRLNRGDTPTLTDLEILARNCKEVYEILHKEGVIKEPLT